MSEIALHAGDLASQVQFAQLVTKGDPRKSLLPVAYREEPGNVLIAVGLGAAMGLSPAESLYRIDVIQGTPAASAELIAQNVRKAGHKLRVRVSENPPSATATIIRSDDPDEPVTITRDMAWAQSMGLASKDNYKKQPGTMLQWRAITACARLACPEALYGVAYTPDELSDNVIRGAVTTSSVSVADEFTAPEPAAPPELTDDVHDAEVVEEPETGEAITKAQSKALHASFNDAGITERDQRLDYCRNLIGRELDTSNDLTKVEASRIIDALKADAEGSEQS